MCSGLDLFRDYIAFGSVSGMDRFNSDQVDIGSGQFRLFEYSGFEFNSILLFCF